MVSFLMTHKSIRHRSLPILNKVLLIFMVTSLELIVQVIYFISVRGSSHLISSGRCCFFSSLSEGITLGSVRSRYEILYRLGYTELVSFTTTLNILHGVQACFAPYKQICINVYGSRSDRISRERSCGYIPLLHVSKSCAYLW